MGGKSTEHGWNHHRKVRPLYERMSQVQSSVSQPKAVKEPLQSTKPNLRQDKQNAMTFKT